MSTKSTEKNQSTGQAKIYEMITERIISLLENGEIPWKKPWAGGGNPMNFISKKSYRGINPFILASGGFTSPYWMSFKQVKQKGGTVKKGEKGFPVVFWKWIDLKEETNSEGEKVKGRIPLLRYYTVFNSEQCEGIETPELEKRDFQPIAEAELIIHGMPNQPEITHSEPRAYYRPQADSVNMPKSNLFNSDEEYYNVLFHELVHSTGHKTRLDRHAQDKANHMFGSVDYSKEELVAEMGAAFLCGTCEIEQTTIENSAAYIQGWLSALKSDPKFVVMAAAKAQKAADYILNKKFDN